MSELVPPPPEITREARQAVLQNAIAGYLRSGFHVVSQTTLSDASAGSYRRVQM